MATVFCINTALVWNSSSYRPNCCFLQNFRHILTNEPDTADSDMSTKSLATQTDNLFGTYPYQLWLSFICRNQSYCLKHSTARAVMHSRGLNLQATLQNCFISNMLITLRHCFISFSQFKIFLSVRVFILFDFNYFINLLIRFLHHFIVQHLHHTLQKAPYKYTWIDWLIWHAEFVSTLMKISIKYII